MRGNQGALTLPILLFLGIGLTTGIGILALLERWRVQARGQLQLDLCISDRVRSLQGTAMKIETLNERLREIRRLRELLGWIPGAPPLSETVSEAAETAVVLAQEALRLQWTGLKHAPCDSSRMPGPGNAGLIIPHFTPHLWKRTPERDRWGPGPLELQNPLTQEPTEQLIVQAQWRKRRSAARLNLSPRDSGDHRRASLQWVPPPLDSVSREFLLDP